MIIKRLEMHNFGVYAGDNQFVFEGDKPIVLIGGMNGRGKTTFLEAVLIALYGSNSFAYTESKYKSYAQYLRSFVNKSAEDKCCSVVLEFEIFNGDVERYVIKREWDTLTKKTEERIKVYKDGTLNEFLTNNWTLFVENILPSALSSFFFFDGEKIAEMAVDNSNNQLKNAIRAMLGITVLDALENDISRNIKRIHKENSSSETADGVQKLRDEKDEAADQLRSIEEQIEQAEIILTEDTNKLDELHHLYAVEGGNAVEKKQSIMQNRASLKAQLISEEERLYSISAEVLPLLMVSDLVSDIKLQATDEHNDSILRQAVSQLEVLLTDFEESYSGDTKASKDFYEYVRSQTADDCVESVYELSDQALFQVNELVETKITEARDLTEEILVSKRKLEKQISEQDSYLTLDINEKELQSIFSKIKKVEKKIVEDKVVLSKLDQKRASANARVMSTTAEFNKYVEAYLATAEMIDSTERTLKYSNMALQILDRYQVELQKRKADLLSNTITECYKKLANKKNLINRIEMDPESLNVKYVSGDGLEVGRDSLSAGEQQLMVISILWALAICSKKKLPVIIDTPLSRLDSLHRAALIKTYFPNAGEQTIILSTDSEIDSKYYQLMKDDIGDEFTLNYDERTKSTSIERGYLIGLDK
ncbi:DNA sulfur modification protein DndD [Roseburia inulinivorans]